MYVLIWRRIINTLARNYFCLFNKQRPVCRQNKIDDQNSLYLHTFINKRSLDMADNVYTQTGAGIQLDPEGERARDKDDHFDVTKDKLYDGDPDWYDAEMDEELADHFLDKHLGPNRGKPKTDAVLSCPGCFSVLCNQCQQHEEYQNQYRAMLVTENVDVNKEDEIEYRDKESNQSSDNSNMNTENSEVTIYNPVKCIICGTEVGMYDKKDEIYYFFDVIAADN